MTRLFSVFWLGALTVWAGSSLAAQDITPPPPSAPVPAPAEPQPELVEGLLDLLQQPRPAPAGDDSQRQQLSPEDLGLGGEDLSDRSANPLEAVRQSMLIAAGFLHKGLADNDTQQLQEDIVQRLDDLIAEMEKAQSEQRNSKSQQQTAQTEAESSQESAAEQEPRQEQSSSDDQSRPPEAGDQADDGPGQDSAASTQGRVRLADPRALQQSVWGQLPEQVRKQMQSRMVEQFLPSYREQIEAYFQALLEDR
jgi:hypothetical protein